MKYEKIFRNVNIFLANVKFNTYICKCKFQLIINLIKPRSMANVIKTKKYAYKVFGTDTVRYAKRAIRYSTMEGNYLTTSPLGERIHNS